MHFWKINEWLSPALDLNTEVFFGIFCLLVDVFFGRPRDFKRIADMQAILLMSDVFSQGKLGHVKLS